MAAEEELLQRITFRPDVLGGKPIIRDMRIAVEHILGMLASGMSPADIIRDYEILELEDVQACLVYAHRSAMGEQVLERAVTAR